MIYTTYDPIYLPGYNIQNYTAIGTQIINTPYRVGDPIGDQWKLLGYIGRGGMGIVYLAVNQSNDELVALKTIREDIKADKMIREYFYNEALSWVRIGSHPYILEAKEVVKIADRIYVSMEYIPPSKSMKGCSLNNWLTSYGSFDERQILRWGIQFCYGIEHACKNGIKCHRDINPNNILIDQEKNIRVADFGLAVPIDWQKEVSGRCGTPKYASPEMFNKSVQVDERSDIYSFGIVLFEMFTGRFPFAVDNTNFHNHVDWKNDFWNYWKDAHNSESVPDAGEPFGKIIHKCLEKDPYNRFSSFKELREELFKLSKKYGVVIDKPALRGPTSLELNDKGSRFLGLGMFQEAIKYFDRVLNIDESDTHALKGKGYCLYGLGHNHESIQLFDLVLSHNKSDITAIMGKALSLQKIKCYDEAEQCFNKALDIKPNMPVLWHHKGINYMNMGLPNLSIDCYLRALDLLVSLKRSDEAQDIVKESLYHFPHHTRLRQLYGWILRLKGYMEEGLRKSLSVMNGLYTDDLEIDPETAGILAGTYKRLWIARGQRDIDMLQKSYDLYNRAWIDSKKTNMYVGINASALSLFLGRANDSKNIAMEIKTAYKNRSLSSHLASGIHFSSYWDRVTLAEAELLLGQLGRARRIYNDVMMLYHNKRSYIDTTMDQIDLILPRLGLSINAGQFMQLSLKTPGASRVCIGIICPEGLKYTERLKVQLKAVMNELNEELPDNISIDLISQLKNPSEIQIVKMILKEYKSLLKISVTVEMNECPADLSSKNSISRKEFQYLLNIAEEILTLSPVNSRDGTSISMDQFVIDHCDILIVFRCFTEKTGNKKILDYAKEKGIPFIIIDAEFPYQATFEQREKIKTLNDFKGELSMYKPEPIDTSNIELQDDLLELSELLAENVHNIWAKKRMDEGWTYGLERDDSTKKHPDLIPYIDLPASEKEYDRKMAIETLQVIISLGYKIEKV